tara:strand:- start:353 stop:481 length:129 start_codon:yes stop_codon:yes gene_type:complete
MLVELDHVILLQVLLQHIQLVVVVEQWLLVEMVQLQQQADVK